MKFTAMIITLLAASLCAGCVSVNFGGSGGPKHAEGVRYAEPARPFVHESRDDVDAAWKNPHNGNMISYLTDCQDGSDPSLDSIVNGALNGLSELHIESSQNIMVQDRGARRTVATGKVDGVPSKIDLLVYKRNRCIYMLSYVGVLDNFDADHAEFEKFLAGFRAP